MKKKGLIESAGFKILLAVVALLILVMLNIKYGWVKGEMFFNQVSSCQGILPNQAGECKDSCSAEDTNIGQATCTKNRVCCIQFNVQKEKSILPVAIGSNNLDYRFDVGYIGPDYPVTKDANGNNVMAVPAGCTRWDNSAFTSLVCPPDKDITLNIKVKVENTGRGVIKVFANPYMIRNDDIGTLKNFSTPANAKILFVKGINSANETRATVLIKGTDAKDNSFFKIYPYARCITRECLHVDSRGIIMKNPDENEFMIVKIVKP